MRIKGLIPVIAGLMLLVVLGSALAMWYDTLKIQATIKTGKVDVEFGTPTPTEEPEAGGKDVGQCLASLAQIENEGPGNKNDADLNITIVNGYPSYNCTVTFEVKNVGTIPVKGPYNRTAPDGLMSYPTTVQDVDLNHDGEPDVNIKFNMPIKQIDAGDSETFSISIHIKQGMPENSTFTLQYLLHFVQWNEAPE